MTVRSTLKRMRCTSAVKNRLAFVLKRKFRSRKPFFQLRLGAARAPTPAAFRVPRRARPGPVPRCLFFFVPSRTVPRPLSLSPGRRGDLRRGDRPPPPPHGPGSGRAAAGPGPGRAALCAAGRGAGPGGAGAGPGSARLRLPPRRPAPLSPYLRGYDVSASLP